MPIWHQSPKLTPRYFLETPRLFGYPILSSFYISSQILSPVISALPDTKVTSTL